MRNVLLVDDEPMMLDLLTLCLSPHGYSCIKTKSAKEAIDYLGKQPIDLIILDVMMPEMDGWEACREIRKDWDTPIIMLTARDEKQDIVNGLNLGADDYISKPFDEEELIARINAVIRRKGNKKENIPFKGLLLNQGSFELQYNGIEIPLTPKEFGMMELFLNNQNKVFSREHLITSIWGHDVKTEDRTIDSHVRNVRDKLRKAGFPVDDYLHTVWGVGYKWTKKAVKL